jgi:hypothetical protein
MGGFGQGAQQIDPERLAAISQPRKKGLFGGAFRPDSPLWKIMGGAGDVITGEPVYTQGLMHQNAQRQRGLMEQAQAEAENAQWYAREKWKLDNHPKEPPKPGTFEWYQGANPADRSQYDMYNPIVIDGPDGRYVVPRAALQGQGGMPTAPVGKLTPIGGPASPAPGGFPR